MKKEVFKLPSFVYHEPDRPCPHITSGSLSASKDSAAFSPAASLTPFTSTTLLLVDLPSIMAAPATETPNMDQQVDLSTIPISPNGKEDAGETKDDGKTVTVFHDKDNFNVKHPLQNKWTLWFTKPPSGKVIFSRLLKIRTSFGTDSDSIGR